MTNTLPSLLSFEMEPCLCLLDDMDPDGFCYYCRTYNRLYDTRPTIDIRRGWLREIIKALASGRTLPNGRGISFAVYMLRSFRRPAPFAGS